MNDQSLQLKIDGLAFIATYRQIANTVEVEWAGMSRAQPIGSVRLDVAAANVLRTMVRRARRAPGNTLTDVDPVRLQP
jgi:hypothetical protein